MTPEIYSPELHERLADLSIMQATSEGLMMHEQAQDAAAAWLRIPTRSASACTGAQPRVNCGRNRRRRTDRTGGDTRPTCCTC